MAEILVVDDDESIATAFQHFLRHEGHAFRIASNAGDAARLIAERRPNLVFMDIRMPGTDGLQALAEFRARFQGLTIVMMTAYGTSQTSIDAIRAGAFEYLTKPLDLDQLRSVIDKALSAGQTRDGSGTEREESTEPAPAVTLVGEAPAMLDVYKMIGRLSTNDVPALVVGEHGTGKQLVLETIHTNSARGSEPFVFLDCRALTPEAIEREVFGRQAGTIQLSGVEALPLATQSRIARVLTTVPSHPEPLRPALQVRILASTDQDLGEHIRQGSFSRELRDALAVITIKLPPLRDRREDIPLLVKYFIQRSNVELNRTIRGADEAALQMLHGHSWPGNVGELERVIKRACIVSAGDVITPDALGDTLTEAGFDAENVESGLREAVRMTLYERLVDRPGTASSSAFHDIVELVESTLVKEALSITHGNQVKAAEILGLNRATLRKKMSPEE